MNYEDFEDYIFDLIHRQSNYALNDPDITKAFLNYASNYPYNEYHSDPKNGKFVYSEDLFIKFFNEMIASMIEEYAEQFLTSADYNINEW